MEKELTNRDFHLVLAKATSEIISKKFNISNEQAFNLFKLSDLFAKLMSSTDEFDQVVPEDLYELWKNERLVCYPVSDTEIKDGLLQGMSLK